MLPSRPAFSLASTVKNSVGLYLIALAGFFALFGAVTKDGIRLFQEAHGINLEGAI